MENKETLSINDEYLKITKSTIDIDYNVLFKIITGLLEHRRKLCINILSCKDDNTCKELQEAYNYIQHNIKQLLNI